MNFDQSAHGLDLRRQVRQLLREPAVTAEVSRCHSAAADEDVFPTQAYRRLGAAGLLAPHWPVASGGRGGQLSDSAVVAEELVLHGVPDTPRVNSIDNAGTAIAVAGSEALRDRVLPAIAAGECSIAVLYSEPGAGSDLTAAATTAVRCADGWQLNGVKRWTAKASFAKYGLCLARTGPRPGLAGLTLLLVPLQQPGVRMRLLPALNGEPLYEVAFTGAVAADDDRIGEVGGAWPVVAQTLAMERTGVCFAARALRWLYLLAEAAAAGRVELRSDHRAAHSQLVRRATAARLLAWRAVEAMQYGNGDAVIHTARAKWFASETAYAVARLVASVVATSTADTAGTGVAELRVAAREQHGLILAAGSSEALLDNLVAGFGVRDREGAPDATD